MTLQPGKYYWSSCGKSTNQPFGNGAHQETDFQPVEFVITEEKPVAMCLCKHTEDPPFCDVSHSKLATATP